MRLKTVTIFLAIQSITGCSNAENASSKQENLNVTEALPATEAAADAASNTSDKSAQEASKDVKIDSATTVPSAEIKISIPQIAYTYEYGYRVSASGMPAMQRAHADLCERKGLKVCHILNMSQDGSEGAYASGKLEIEVAAPYARTFADELSKIAADNGGDAISSSIAGEDLSKQIVDTQARLRARIVLRDRLMEILQTRNGKVSELVEAERGVAEVNEEIDTAQSWLAEMKGRVAFSKMNLNYSSSSPGAGGFSAPIRDALGSVAATFGVAIAAIIYILTFLLPWAALVALLLWVKRKRGWSWRFWARNKNSNRYSDE